MYESNREKRTVKSHHNKKMQKQLLKLKLMTYLLADWSNLHLHIHDGYC